MRRLTTLLAASLAIAATDAAEACDLSILPENMGQVAGFNAMQGAAVMQPVRLRLRNDSDEACTGMLMFNRTEAAADLRAGHGGTIGYQIVDERAVNAVLFEPTRSLATALPVRVGPKTSILLSPRMRIPGGQDVRSGRYSARLDASVKDAVTGVELDRQSVELVSEVTPSVEANWVGVSRGEGSRTASLDLGDLSTGHVRSAGLQMRTNSDVTVEIESMNRGELAHSSDPDSAVGYSLSVDGETLPLNGTQRIQRINGTGGTVDANLPLRFVVGDTSRARAGEYSDTILVRISAR